MKGYCLNCFRKNVDLDWKGLCYSCSAKGVELGTRGDGWVYLIFYTWGFIFFTTLIPRSILELSFPFLNYSAHFWGIVLTSFILYIILFIIPMIYLRKRYRLLYYVGSVYMFILLPLKRLYYWLVLGGDTFLFY